MVGIDWLGVVVFERSQLWIMAKVTPKGEVIGYYAQCLIHGKHFDITPRLAASLIYPDKHCPDCIAEKPERDWRKPSELAQLLNAMQSGAQSVEVEFDPAESFEFSMPDRIATPN